MSKFIYETVQSDLGENGVRTITLNRPDCLNAMNRQLIDDVARAFDDANADEATRSIVFTGAGRAFCAGDDRHDHVHPESEAQARDLVDAIQRTTRAIVFGAKPVVGAINGWAVGGGFEWAINCDFPIWAESAKGTPKSIITRLTKGKEILWCRSTNSLRTILAPLPESRSI